MPCRCGTRTGPVSPYTTPVRDFCQLWLCQFSCVSVRAPYGTLAGHALAPYGSRRIWKILKNPVRGPHDAHTGIARGSREVLRIIQPNHQYADVWSRTGPVAWCDHGNSTDVKFLWVLHSASRASNRTGDKNRTGPVVGCNWCAPDCMIYIMNYLYTVCGLMALHGQTITPMYVTPCNAIRAKWVYR